MKIDEIISESKDRKELRPMHKQALSNLTQYDQLDNASNPYLAYRFAVALAGSPRADMEHRSPIGSDLHIIDYTDADAEIRKGAEKSFGIKPTRSTGKGSAELPGVNKTSPVAVKKKNKYGV